MCNNRSSSVAILGVPIDNVTMEDVLRRIDRSIREGGFHQIATANVDFLINSIHDRELKEILSACYLVLPDGMPLVWASRLMGASLQERVSGSDLVPRIIELSARRAYRIFLLGSDEVSSNGAARWVAQHHPSTQVVGRCCPEYKDLDEMDHETILRQIDAAQPDILLVAFGSPKQEKWLSMHRHRLRVPVCLGVGCSFDLLAGRLPRAPVWMRDCGLEWLFRVWQEPRRLSLRYTRDAVGLARYMSVQLMATAAQHKPACMSRITEESIGAVTVLRVSGSLTAAPVASFEQEARIAVAQAHHIVLDLTSTTYLGPDALGALLHIADIAKRHDRELWLTGLQPSQSRMIHATQLHYDFRTAPKVADALRRISPTAVQMSIESGKDWAICRMGGRLIPLNREDATGVCQQVLKMIEHPVTLGAMRRNPRAAMHSNSA
jgi:N-acetylglucosaminyldiphosphoundecaprenol N-acetyl-beta-D-mannosaminyltransferase